MNRLNSLIVIMTIILPSLGAVTGWLDSLGPEQFVDVMDNPDGTYTAMWETDGA